MKRYDCEISNPALSFACLRSERRCGGELFLGCLTILCAALWFLAPQPVFCQNADASTEAEPAALPAHSARQPAESEIVVNGLSSVGHCRYFADSWWSNIHFVGVEYDRHHWGYFLKARADYVAEIQPVVILNQPRYTDYWGDPLGRARETVPGVGISPVGVRLMWFSNRAVKPYFMLKGGMFYFNHRALSQLSSHQDLSIQAGIGVQFHLKGRLDMRVGYSYLHFSNGLMVPSDPGLDSMTCTAGLSYHLGKHVH